MTNFGIESETIEFKKTTAERKEAMIDICAILNKHSRGSLYFGIAPNGDIKGQMISGKTLDEVSTVIKEAIRPMIYPTISKIQIDDKGIVLVEFSGEDKPYSAYGRYYLRVADRSEEMTPAQLRKFMNSTGTNETWEKTLLNKGVENIDDNALLDFYNKSISCGRLEEMADYNKDNLLTRLGLLENGKLNNAGYYLFSKDNPITLKMAVYATDEKTTFIDVNRVKGNMYTLIDVALKYIKAHINWEVIYDGRSRVEIPEIPSIALREIVINSFAHADYRNQTEHEISIHPNCVQIYNPGTFPDGLTPLDFINDHYRSIPKNKLMLETLYKSKDVEIFGGGFKKVDKACKESGILFEYEGNEYGFVFTFKRKNVTVNVTQSVTDDSINVLSATERQVYTLLKENPNYSREQLAEKVGKSVRTIQRIINSLKEKNIIFRIGSDKAGYWEIK